MGFLKKHNKGLFVVAGLIDYGISLVGFFLVCESAKEAVGYWLILVGAIYLFTNNLFKLGKVFGVKINNWIYDLLKLMNDKLQDG